MTTLADIRTKVRRLTGRPTAQDITNDQIDEYINTFYLYDFPEELRLFHLNTVFTFATEPNVDRYPMANIAVTTAGGADTAINVYYNLSPPAYVAGYETSFSQSLEQFFTTYPKLAQVNETVQGDGTTGPYTLTFANTPVLQNELTIGAIDNTNTLIAVQDVPTNASVGTLAEMNTGTAVVGSINYLTGAVSVTFANAIPTGNDITFSTVPYAAGRPQALLYYNDVITLRPVPDASYRVEIKAFTQPTQLINDAESPELKQWWQYLAYGAAKKIFQDSGDGDGEQAIMPELMNQEMLALRRSIVQQTPERTATIYTSFNGYPYGNYNNRF